MGARSGGRNRNLVCFGEKGKKTYTNGIAHQLRQLACVLLAAVRELRIATNAAFQVEHRLAVLEIWSATSKSLAWASSEGENGIAYSRQPDRSGADVKVHQIVDDSALQIVLDPVDDDLFPDIHDLEIRQVILVAVVVDGLVHLLVVADSIAEVLGSNLGSCPT